jgi:DNA-directed RNA polymerase specialized sigma54-like protein
LKSKLSSQVHLLDQQAVSSLWTDLRNQIENSFANQEQLGIAQFCLESLDEAGRLPENIIVLLTQKGFERKLIQRVIERLQEFGPPGVFGVGMVGQYRLQLFALGFGPKDLPLRLLGHWQDLLSKGLGPEPDRQTAGCGFQFHQPASYTRVQVSNLLRIMLHNSQRC